MPSPTRSTPEPGPADATRRRVLTRRVVAASLSSRKANLCRYLIMLPIGLIALLAIAAQSGLVGWVLLPTIGRAINADVSAGSVVIAASGAMVLTDVEVRHPGIDGPGGQIVSIAKVEAVIDWASAFGGLSAIRELRLTDPRVRVSFDRESDLTNLTGLRLPDTSGAAGPARLPTIVVSDGMIEMGEHAGASYDLLKRMLVGGSLRPDPGAVDRAYLIEFVELNRGSREATTGTSVTGRVDDRGVEVSIAGVSLGGWGPAQVPSLYRRQVAELKLRGEISRFTLRVPSEAAMRRPGGPTGASAVARVDGVELTLPIEADTAEGRLPLRGVSGEISFRDNTLETRITGIAADVPMRVHVVYELPEEGTALVDAPFLAKLEVDEYLLDRRPEFVPFLPTDVARWLRRFAATDEQAGDFAISPTAVISSAVEIRRSAPVSPGARPEVEFNGELAFSKGTGAYHLFPYEFGSLEGIVQFREDRIDIVEISGVAETGATLIVEGWISPLGEEAEVDLDILVTDVPIDETLEAALSEERVETIRQLFDDEAYEALVERGLVLQPDHARLLREERLAVSQEPPAPSRDARLDAIDRALAAPVFQHRGLGELRISLHRPPGLMTEWNREVFVRLEEAGLLLKEFPLPVLVRQAELLLTETTADIRSGSFLPITGRYGTVTGSAITKGGFTPAFSFRAEDVRTDELLRFAISPTDGEGNPRSTERAAAVEVLDGLGINGVISATGRVLRRANGRLGFDVDVDLGRITLAPQPYDDLAPMLVSGETGVVRVTESGLRLDARATGIAISGDDSIDRPATATIGMALDWSNADAGLAVEALIAAESVAASMPLEQVVAAFSGGATPATDGMRSLRETFRPTGRARVSAEVSTRAGRTVSSAVVDRLEDVEVGWLGDRLRLDDPRGVVRLVAEDHAYLATESLTGSLVFANEPAGEVTIAGSMNLAAAVGDPDRVLRVDLSGGAFESRMAKEIARQIVGGVPAKEYLEHEARGSFDATLALTPLREPPGEDVPPGVARIAFLETELRPRTAGFTRRGQPVWFDRVEGRVVASSRRTRLDSVRAIGHGIEALLAGEIVPDGRGGVFVDLGLEAAAARLDPVVRAALPTPVNEQIDALQMGSDGPVRLSDGRIRVRSAPASDGSTEPRVWLTFDGVVSAEGGSLFLGTPVDGVAGTATVHSAIAPDRPAALVRVFASVDRARMLGVWLRDGLLRLEGDGVRPGEIVVPHVSASLAGGAVSGHAALHPVDGTRTDADSAYRFDLRFADLVLSTLLDEMDASKAGLDSVDQLERRRPTTGARIDGSVQVGGIVGRDATRRGRGSFEISGGSVVETPAIVRLVELVNLQVPAASDLDFASLEFIADGTVVQINELMLVSESVQLFGYGTVTLPELVFDLRFLTRGTRRYPVLDFVLNMLRDELFTTRLTGRAGDLRTASELVPETRRIIGGALATEGADWARAVSEMRRRADERLVRERAAKRITRQLIRPAPDPEPRSDAAPVAVVAPTRSE